MSEPLRQLHEEPVELVLADGSLGRHVGVSIRLDLIHPYFRRVMHSRVDLYMPHVGRTLARLAERMEARAATIRLRDPSGPHEIRELAAINAIVGEMRGIEPQAAGEGRPAPLRLVQGTAQRRRAAGADSLSQNPRPTGEAGR